MIFTKHFYCAVVVSASLLFVNCSSAVNNSNGPVATGPQPASKSVPDEFSKQTATLDQYCTSEAGDLHSKVQLNVSKVEAKTGKRLPLNDVYDRMAGLGPHVRSTGKYDCEQLIFRALLEMAPEMQSQQAIEELPES